MKLWIVYTRERNDPQTDCVKEFTDKSKAIEYASWSQWHGLSVLMIETDDKGGKERKIRWKIPAKIKKQIKYEETRMREIFKR